MSWRLATVLILFTVLSMSQIEAAPADKFIVIFDDEVFLDHVCFYINITNNQDSNDDFPFKPMLNQTSLDLSLADARFYEWKSYEIYGQRCNTCQREICDKNATVTCYYEDISDCNLCGSTPTTTTAYGWKERTLVARNEQPGELSHQFEEVQIKKGETASYMLCYDFGEVAASSHGFIWLDVKGKIYADLDSSSWWNESWSYYAPINITNNNDTVNISKDFYKSWSMNITINHTALVTAGKSSANGDDVRVICGDAEADRVNMTAFNLAATEIWFNWTGEDIVGTSLGTWYNDTHCQLYYGNAGAGAPPATYTNVFTYGNPGTVDDFTENVSGTCISEVSGKWLNFTARTNFGTCAITFSPVITTGMWMLRYNTSYAVDGNRLKFFSPGDATTDSGVEYTRTVQFGSDTDATLRICYGESRVCPQVGDVSPNTEINVEILVDMDRLTKEAGVDVWITNSSGRFQLVDNKGYDDGNANNIMNDIGMLRQVSESAAKQQQLAQIVFYPYIFPLQTAALGTEVTLLEFYNVTLEAPANGTITNGNTPDFSFRFNGTYATASCELFVGGLGFGVNTSTVNDTSTTITANASISDGINIAWFVNCTNSTDTQQSDTTRYITIDTDAPDITVVSPVNGTTHSINVDVDVTADEAVDSWWYELDSSGTNITFTPNITLVGLSAGTHNITICANDTAGNLNCTAVIYFDVVLRAKTVCIVEPILITNQDNEEIEIGWSFDCDSNTVDGDLFVSGNIIAENEFIPQYIFSHTNETISLTGANTWTNVTFIQEEADLKRGITHAHNDDTNHTFTITVSGVYDIEFDFDAIDTSASSTDIDVAGRVIYTNGTEITGSVFETDITKKDTETELSHEFLANLNAGDSIVFQFIADDADVQISTHGTFGDHPESASMVMEKIANLP